MKEVLIMAKVTKDTIIAEALQICPDSAELFMEIGMHCLYCPPLRANPLSRLAWFTVVIPISLLMISIS